MAFSLWAWCLLPSAIFFSGPCRVPCCLSPGLWDDGGWSGQNLAPLGVYGPTLGLESPLEPRASDF